MTTGNSSPKTLAQIADILEGLLPLLYTPETLSGTYEDGTRLLGVLRKLRAAGTIIQVYRTELWHEQAKNDAERRRQERAASRERIRIAELEADRIGTSGAINSRRTS